MKEFTRERNLMHVSIVEKTSPLLFIETDMKEFTLEGNLMHVSIVEKPSTTPVLVTNMNVGTLQRNLMHELFGKAFNNSSRCNRY